VGEYEMTIQIAAILFTLAWFGISTFYANSMSWFGTDTIGLRITGSIVWGFASLIGIIGFGGIILFLIVLCLGV
jgi:hypothetical protein